MNLSIGSGSWGAIALVVVYGILGALFPVVAWRVRRRWGGRGLVLFALVMSAVLTLLMQSWLAGRVDLLPMSPERHALVPRFVRAFFGIWLVAFGVSAFIIERHHRRGHTELTPIATVRALAGFYAGFLIAFLAYAVIELRPLLD
jgi:hypothetical protein